MAEDTPVWFITGRSTGFGRELAEAVPGFRSGPPDRSRADTDAREDVTRGADRPDHRKAA